MVVVSSRLVIGCSQLQLNQIETTASQNVRNLSYVINLDFSASTIPVLDCLHDTFLNEWRLLDDF